MPDVYPRLYVERALIRAKKIAEVLQGLPSDPPSEEATMVVSAAQKELDLLTSDLRHFLYNPKEKGAYEYK